MSTGVGRLARLVGGVALLLVVLAPAVVAQADRPARPSGYVADPSGALGPGRQAELDAQLADYEARTENEIAVAIVRTTGGQPIEDYALALFNEWELGQAELNNGVLILVALDDRRLRLQVGTGLEDEIPPDRGQAIIDEEIIPRLRNGDLAGGVNAAVIGVRRALGDDVATPDAGNGSGPVTRAPTPYIEDRRFDAPTYEPEPVTPFPGFSDEDPGSDLMPMFVLGAIGIGVMSLVKGAGRSLGGGMSGLAGFGSDRCPSCGSTVSYRGRTVGGGRMSEYSCPSCGFEDRRVRGSGWGAGSIFGSGSLFGDDDDDDRGGFWGSSSRSSSSGSSWSGSSGSGGSSSSGSSSSSSSSSSSGAGGGGSSRGGGASGSW